MAGNTFITPQVIARTALGALRMDLVLPRLVSRDAEADFQGAQGFTINVRVPPTVTGGGARTYGQTLRDAATPIVLDRITETTIPVTMGPELYKGVPVTDEEFTFTLDNFNERVLAPLTQVVGEGVEAVIAGAVNGLAASTTITPAADGSDLHESILEARMQLNKANVPQTGRVLAVSPEIELLLLQDPENRLVRYDASGSAEALRNATIGRLYGMDVVTVNDLTPLSYIIFVKEAFTLVVRAPSVPAGCTFGASASYQGIALRFIRDYDSAFLQDRAIVSTFAGAKVLDAVRAVRVVAA